MGTFGARDRDGREVKGEGGEVMVIDGQQDTHFSFFFGINLRYLIEFYLTD